MYTRFIIALLLLLPFDTACSMELWDFPATPPEDSTSAINAQKSDTITVIQWNIGHFSLGVSKNSRIKDVNFLSALQGFEDLFTRAKADIISLNEYSVYFANTANHPRCLTDTLLFYTYPFRVIGNNAKQRNYCLNAIFSTLQIFEAKTIDYETNKHSGLTSSTGTSITDFYYILSYINLFGKKVPFISTHLAFNLENDQVVLNQVKELIKNLENEEFVIICGDFNINASNLSLFTEAGYSMANEGSIATYPSPDPYKSLDNILVKGFEISNPRTIPTLLSDHFPIICEISIKADSNITVSSTFTDYE